MGEKLNLLKNIWKLVGMMLDASCKLDQKISIRNRAIEVWSWDMFKAAPFNNKNISMTNVNRECVNFLGHPVFLIDSDSELKVSSPATSICNYGIGSNLHNIIVKFNYSNIINFTIFLFFSLTNCLQNLLWINRFILNRIYWFL